MLKLQKSHTKLQGNLKNQDLGKLIRLKIVNSTMDNLILYFQPHCGIHNWHFQRSHCWSHFWVHWTRSEYRQFQKENWISDWLVPHQDNFQCCKWLFKIFINMLFHIAHVCHAIKDWKQKKCIFFFSISLIFLFQAYRVTKTIF